MLPPLEIDITTARMMTTGASSALFAKLLVVADATFVTADLVANTMTIASHGLETGDGPVRVSTTTTLPAGLVAGTDYWVIKVDANTFKLAASLANAVADAPTAVDITTAGTGVHTLSDVATTSRVLFDANDYVTEYIVTTDTACWVKQGTLPSVAAAAAAANALVTAGCALRINPAHGRYVAAIQATAGAKAMIARITKG